MYVASGNPAPGQFRVIGHADGSSGPTGEVGEYVSTTNAGGTSITSGTAILIAGPISLSPGDWDVSAGITFNFGATTSFTFLSAGLSWNIGNPPVGQILAAPALLSDSQATITTPALPGVTIFDLENFKYGTPAAVPGAFATPPDMAFTVQPIRVVVGPGAPNPFLLGLVALATFTVSTLTGGGSIRARRVR